VLGFVGSSGKGTKPVPISEQQYLDSLHGSVNVSSSKSIVVDEINNDNIKPTIKFAPNMVVEIAIGKFAGQSGKITNINNEIGIAEIELDNLGKVEVPYSDIKK
jgi:transcriptional antiterminator NusG